jgi:NAD(P)-dependent dehydrogenase (short-subunit alcohol dehydrogenase family)
MRWTDSLAGRVAIVTGGAGGIGAATAIRFSALGASVMVADLDAVAGASLAERIGGAFRSTDVAEEDAVSALVDETIDRFGKLDIMVNNAGIVGPIGSVLETSGTAWSRTMAVLLDGVFFGIKHAGRAMRARGGVILSTTSVAGLRGGLGPHVYTAAKHGVIGLTRSAAAELSAYGIRVNAVAPGKTDTAMPGQLRRALDPTAVSPPAEIAADEIAAAFAYLASDMALSVTGEILKIDRGLSAFGAQPPSLLGGESRFVDAHFREKTA